MSVAFYYDKLCPGVKAWRIYEAWPFLGATPQGALNEWQLWFLQPHNGWDDAAQHCPSKKCPSFSGQGTSGFMTLKQICACEPEGTAFCSPAVGFWFPSLFSAGVLRKSQKRPSRVRQVPFKNVEVRVQNVWTLQALGLMRNLMLLAIYNIWCWPSVSCPLWEEWQYLSEQCELTIEEHPVTWNSNL